MLPKSAIKSPPSAGPKTDDDVEVGLGAVLTFRNFVPASISDNKLLLWLEKYAIFSYF